MTRTVTREIADYGTPESFKKQGKIFVASGPGKGNAVKAKSLTLLERMERSGSISPRHFAAGSKFHGHFVKARLERYSTLNLFRTVGGITDGESYLFNLTEVRKALIALGSGLQPSIIWHVCGLENQLSKWVKDRQSAGLLMNEHHAKGILIAGLDVLADHFGV